MKILVQKTDLVAALKTADEATYKDATVDALRCVKIEAKDGAIRVVGNDCSLGIRLVLDGQIVEEGAAVFAAKSIVAFLKNAPAGVVRLETANADETTLRVSFRQTHIELQGEAHPDDCADWLEADPAGTHALVAAEDLVEALRATLLAADETLDRPALRSVHMEIDHGVASFVATECRRLHVMRIPTAFTDHELRATANLPLSVAKLLVKLFAKKRIGIRIRVQGQCVYFDCIDLGGIELYAKQNTAPYPEYEKILPKDETMAAEPIVVQSDELLAALDRIEAAAEREKYRDTIYAGRDGEMTLDECIVRCDNNSGDDPRGRDIAQIGSWLRELRALRTAPGNAASLREALTAFVSYLTQKRIDEVWAKTTLPEPGLDRLVAQARAALAAPARNCDRFATLDDAFEAHFAYCERRQTPKPHCLGGRDMMCSDCLDCFADWLFAPAKGKEADNG